MSDYEYIESEPSNIFDPNHLNYLEGLEKLLKSKEDIARTFTERPSKKTVPEGWWPGNM